jgi:hypothetical protein
VTVDKTFHQQYGLITRQQARNFALTVRQIDHRVVTGKWAVVHPGVYRASEVKPSWESDLLAATLRSGGVASHRCAAALWSLEIFQQPAVEITVNEGRSTRIAVERVHQSRQWALRDETTRLQIPCTGIERTILDCAGVVGIETLERLAETAIRKRFTTWLRLADCLKDHSAQGRNGCLSLRILLQRRFGDGTVPLSDFSRRVVQLLERANIPTPVVEYPICNSAGRHLLQVDLAWPKLKKAWELDGLAFHFGREDVERDRRKRNAVVAEGWVIQEILWSMYIDKPSELVTMARKFLFKT